MNNYFLDSSVIVEYLRNNKDIIKFIDSFPYDLSSSYVVKAELYEGVNLSKDKSLAKNKLELFFNGLDKVYSITNSSSKIFGEIRASLRVSGNLIEDFDILIASTCVANNLPLITLNIKHFSRIDNLKIYLPDDLN